jgi:predicted HAD superfamily Cof-like phosphohydrolase
MNKMQKQVRDFHIRMGLEWNDTPDMLTTAAIERRINLITEEAWELEVALSNDDMIEAIDAIVDLLYVTFGTAVELGVDIEPFFEEIHNSNMTKDGGRIRADGKLIKPADYTPANLKKVWHYEYGEDYEDD